MQRLREKFSGNPALVTMLLLALFGVSDALWSFHTLSDYGNYYYGSRFLLEGKFGMNVYDPWEFNRMIEATGMSGLYENYTPVPPFSAIFYVPFAFFPAFVSKLLFSLTGLLAFGFVLYRFLQRFPRPGNAWLVVMLFFPLRSNLENGQTYILLAALLLGGWLLYLDRRYLGAALLWAIAIHLKVAPAIIFVFLLFEKNWKMTGWLAGAVLFLFLATLPFTGIGIWTHYVQDILPRLAVNEINNPFAVYTQSGTTFLQQLLVRDPLLNPNAPFNDPSLFRWINAVYVTILLLAAAFVSLSRKTAPLMRFSFWLFTGMMISGYSTMYGLFLLLFPVIGFWQVRRVSTGPVYVLILLVAFAGIPVQGWEYSGYLLRFARLWLLLLVFVYLVFFIRAELRFSWMLVPLLLLPFGKIFLKEPPDQSSYLLAKEAALLVGDYRWTNDTLYLQTRQARGAWSTELPLPGSAKEDPRLSLRGNQLFFEGRQLTSSPDNKKKPMLGSDGSIIYLSDKDRGVGFTTLRRLPMPVQP